MDGTNSQSNHPESAGSGAQAARQNESRQGQNVEPTGGIHEVSEAVRLINMLADDTWAPMETLMPKPYPPSTARLGDLSKISVKDLRMGIHHRGSYLSLKSVSRASRTDSILVVVVDDFGYASDLNLFNHATYGKEHVQEVLGEGVIFILKEPYLQLVPEGNNPAICVHHPSDVVRLPSHDPRVPERWRTTLREGSMTAQAWKEKGNIDFKTRRYHKAIDNYTQALTCSPTEAEVRTLKLNRAIAYLQLGLHNAALLDVDSAPPSDALVDKALIRKANALYGLGRYQDCCEVLNVLNQDFPEEKTGWDTLSRAIRRIKEQASGKYDFKQMSADAARLKPPHLDYATYIGPVTVKSTETMGRGLFTTKDVKVGDLLLCEKAFVHACPTADEPPVVRIDPKTNLGTEAAHVKLINLIVEKISRDPAQAAVLADLDRGSYKCVDVSEVDGAPVVDAFHVARVTDLNAHLTPPISSGDTYNKSSLSVNYAQYCQNYEQRDYCGIWHTCSFINHSCVFNAHRSFIGDMQIVRAAQDIPADTQVFCSYIFNFDSPQQNQDALKQWGIVCHCTICEANSTTDRHLLAKRGQVMARMVLEQRRPNDAKLREFARDLAETYTLPASDAPRTALSYVQHFLSMGHTDISQPHKTIELVLECFSSLGFIIEGAEIAGGHVAGASMVVKRWSLTRDNVINQWMVLSNAYFRMGAISHGNQAWQYAKLAYKICHGEDDTFDPTSIIC